jgi:hypothetical protein
MADEQTPTSTSNADDIPKFQPGELCAVEWYKDGPVECTDEEKRALKELGENCDNRDMAARREEVILVWKKRLYDRGFQHLLPARNGGWVLPSVGSGYNPNDQDSRSMFIVNIYNSYQQTITSALTREVPPTRFEPNDRDNDVDITMAEGAESLEERIERDNELKAKMEDMARYLWTDARAMFFCTYQRSAEQFGFEDSEPEVVPEDEAELSEGEDEHGESEEQSESTEQAGEQVGASGEESGETDTSGEGEDGEAEGPTGVRKAKGHEVILVEGALEWKMPIKANSLAECPYLRRAIEIDLDIAKANYPDIADQIVPATGGPAGDSLDRLARVNVRLGVMDNFNTTDSQIQDVTETKYFFRRAAFTHIGKKEIRASLMKKFPKGAYVTFCGQTFAEAYNHSIEDHCTNIFAQSGDGAHRPGLGDWLVPVQEVLNNAIELVYDYFTRGVPMTWMDNEMFDLEALKNQPNVPGSTRPFQREAGVTMDQVIWREPVLAFPPELLEFIEALKGDLPQLLCGAFPALFGGGDSAPTDTAGGMMIQRDQALGRVGLPWRRIKEAIANVKLQAVKLLAKNYEGAIALTGSEAVTVEMSSLTGSIRAFPETDENFPVSPTQKQNQIAKLFEESATNPQLAELLFNASNLNELVAAIGIKGFYLPQVASMSKQLGECTLLLKSAPIPNPKLAQATQQIQQLTQALQAIQLKSQMGANGVQPAPELIQGAQQIQQQLAQLQQQVTTLPPLVSSIEIESQDDDATEMQTAWKILTSPRGREMKNGDPQEQSGYQNLKLHYEEHQTAAKDKASQVPQGKPPSVSISSKDLPPKELAAAAMKAGIPADPKDFAEADAAEALAKHPAGGIVQ